MATALASRARAVSNVRRTMKFLTACWRQTSTQITTASLRFGSAISLSLHQFLKQTLVLAHSMGLIKLGHVALDGTQIKANASKHKAMSCGRMDETEARLNAEVAELLKQAEEVDAAEDAEFADFGKGKRGDELPKEL